MNYGRLDLSTVFLKDSKQARDNLVGYLSRGALHFWPWSIGPLV
jgi:hypothetical protein